MVTLWVLFLIATALALMLWIRFGYRTSRISIRGNSRKLEVLFLRRPPIPESWAERWLDLKVLYRAYFSERFMQPRSISIDSDPIHWRAWIQSIWSAKIIALMPKRRGIHRDALGRLTIYPGRYQDEDAVYAVSAFRVPPPILYAITGAISLPKRVYEGDSHVISIDFTVDLDLASETDSNTSTVSKQDDGLAFRLKLESATHTRTIEVTLVAAGFTVASSGDQTVELKPRHYHRDWSCAFPSSGRHQCVLNFVVRSAHPSGMMSTYTHPIWQSVHVVKFDHLNSRQVWLLGVVFAAIASLIALAKGLHELGLLPF